METYTIQDLLDNKIWVKCNKEQTKKLAPYCKNKHKHSGTFAGEVDIVFFIKDDGGFNYNGNNTCNTYGEPLIEFSQIIFPEEFAIGDKVSSIFNAKVYDVNGQYQSWSTNTNFRFIKLINNDLIQLKGDKDCWFKKSDFKLVNKKEKEMNKQEFTVEGSIPLKKALIEELSLILNAYGPDTIKYPYLAPATTQRCIVGRDNACSKHLILPKDYDAAVAAFKAYYEQESIELTIGTGNVKITVSKGKIIAEGNGANGETIPYSEIKGLYTALIRESKIGNWTISWDSLSSRTILIGCKTSNNRVSIQELGDIVEAYKKLN